MRFSGRLLVLLAFCFGLYGASAAELILNRGFEDLVPNVGWETNIYGALPRIERDSVTVHEGRSSLRITAAEPSDTALAQEVRLAPKLWYRFSAWVKTKDLDPKGSSISAALQVQNPKGAGLVASGPSHIQNTDWTNSSVYFQPPADGRTRLCLFFVGFGRGTGTVWFDDVRIEEFEIDQAPIRITNQPLVNAQIDPMQYGQFVEYLCDLVPSMWAERLYDGSFEGLSPYKFAFIKQTDFKERPWYPSGAVNRGRYSLDNESKVSGDVSQKIETEGVEPCTLGLSQDGIFVDRGKVCNFRCWLRAEGFSGPVRVRLHHEGNTYASSEFKPAQQWQNFHSTMVSNARDTAATLSIEFRGPGKLWIDNVSLMPK